jgi:Fic-DOC domain mobile mystery protein B
MRRDPPEPAPWESEESAGATPLDPDETAGLIPSWVATRADLNEAEQQNILRGLSRPRWRRIGAPDLLDDLVARELHGDLFGSVWAWAGTYRSSERNIGVDPRTIGVCVRDLMDDAAVWFAGDHVVPSDEAGCRFHHRLVQIHPFPNGNGRHARVMTDLLIRATGTTPFSWGSATPGTPADTRRAYILALRAADAGDLGPLYRFVRS